MLIGHLLLRPVPLYEDSIGTSSNTRHSGDSEPLLQEQHGHDERPHSPEEDAIISVQNHTRPKLAPNIHGKQLIASPEFWALFVVKAFCLYLSFHSVTLQY